jgi:hypothetical protein
MLTASLCATVAGCGRGRPTPSIWPPFRRGLPKRRAGETPALPVSRRYLHGAGRDVCVPHFLPLFTWCWVGMPAFPVSCRCSHGIGRGARVRREESALAPPCPVQAEGLSVQRARGYQPGAERQRRPRNAGAALSNPGRRSVGPTGQRNPAWGRASASPQERRASKTAGRRSAGIDACVLAWPPADLRPASTRGVCTFRAEDGMIAGGRDGSTAQPMASVLRVTVSSGTHVA